MTDDSNNDWSQVQIGELVDHRKGFAFKSTDYAEFGHPIVRVSNLTDRSIDMSATFFIDPKEAPKYEAVQLRTGDVVIATVGSGPQNPGSLVGRAVYVPPEATGALLNQNTVRLRSNGRIIQRFLFYSLRMAAFQDYLVAGSQGSANQASITLKQIFEFSISLPSHRDQQAIACILGALDDKIELNRRRNRTLEAMARAIFQSWFVDFDPVKAKAAGRTPPGLSSALAALFPDRFKHEDGLIPVGWKFEPLSEVTIFREGPGILAKDFHEGGIPLIRLAGLNKGFSLLAGCNFLDPQKVQQKWSHFRLEMGDVLLSTSASLGRVAEVDEEAVGAIPYTGLITFRAQLNRSNQRYIRHYLASSRFQLQVEAMGAGSVLRHFGPTHLKNMTVLIPSLSVQNAFAVMTEPLDQLVIQHLRESRALAALRNALLPKLISGELRVPDAERIVGRAV